MPLFDLAAPGVAAGLGITGMPVRRGLARGRDPLADHDLDRLAEEALW